MPLVDVDFSMPERPLNGQVAKFLRDADERITEFFRHSRGGCSGFVPSDYGPIYEALRAIVELNLATGSAFCEWGSGFGVVSSLAAMLDFDSCGIEIERDLVDESTLLAEDYDLPVEFIHGSFIPPGGAREAEQVYLHDNDGFSWLVTDTDSTYDELPVEFIHGSFIPPGGAREAEQVYLHDNDGFSWLVTDTDSTYDELGRDPDDFDVIFAYPWPDEERVIFNLFDAYAAKGALLLTQEKFNVLRLQRKVSNPSRQKRSR